jgi:glutathione S-transferase
MYTLYNVKNWGSLAPHLVLEELGIPYQSAWMTPEEVRNPAFREISPLGYIPALRFDDGYVMVESAAIVAFLTAAHPEAGLQPEVGSSDHAAYLSWLAFLSSNLYPAMVMTIHPEGFADGADDQARIAGKGLKQADMLYDLIDGRLGNDGPFLLGEGFSAADLYLFMLACWARPSETLLRARYPAIAAVSDAIRGRPRLKAVLEAHNVMQPKA